MKEFTLLTSESHSLKLTTAEFLSTSSRSMGTSLCTGHLTQVTFSLFTPAKTLGNADCNTTGSYCLMYLQQQIVDGSLHLQGEAVASVVLAQGELVINAEDGHSGDGCAGLRSLLVLLPSLQDFDLQLLQFCPENQT